MTIFTVPHVVIFVIAFFTLRFVSRALARAVPSWIERACIWSALGAVLLGISFALLKNNASFNNLPGANAASQARCNDAIVLGLIGLVVFMYPWISHFNSWWIGNLMTATAPIPSVQEIDQTLTAYYGRAATIEEIAAAQSIYAHNRNEAAAQAVLGAGAFLLFTHRL